MTGKWTSKWIWMGPDWKNINNPDTSAVGFEAGPALSPMAKAALNKFIKDLGTGKAELFKGPLYYQDGTLFLKDGEVATDKQIWTMKQLLKGMSGQSRAK
jgi:simple sugar transport system substrate-binding protein